MSDLPLISWAETHGHRGGETYSEFYDFSRLNAQAERVAKIMIDGGWYSISELKARLPKDSENGIAARVRDFRKDEFGAHTVLKRRRVGQEFKGVWEYRLIWNQRAAA